tara:strand:+ start:928 stop:1194 length:267 start_codon:yes stop_codon:yes gene_type:complete
MEEDNRNQIHPIITIDYNSELISTIEVTAGVLTQVPSANVIRRNWELITKSPNRKVKGDSTVFPLTECIKWLKRACKNRCYSNQSGKT